MSAPVGASPCVTGNAATTQVTTHARLRLVTEPKRKVPARIDGKEQETKTPG